MIFKELNIILDLKKITKIIDKTDKTKLIENFYDAINEANFDYDNQNYGKIEFNGLINKHRRQK